MTRYEIVDHTEYSPDREKGVSHDFLKKKGDKSIKRSSVERKGVLESSPSLKFKERSKSPNKTRGFMK